MCMVTCSDCKWLYSDWIEDGDDEYEEHWCEKGRGVVFDRETNCPDYKKRRVRKRKEKDTECDMCDMRSCCEQNGTVLDITTIADTKRHFMIGLDGGCPKKINPTVEIFRVMNEIGGEK